MRDHQEKNLTLLPDSKKHSSLELPGEPTHQNQDIYVVAKRARLEL